MLQEMEGIRLQTMEGRITDAVEEKIVTIVNKVLDISRMYINRRL